MKIFTVTYIDEDDGCYPFAFSFSTRLKAAQAVEAQALEMFNAHLDPNDIGPAPTFPGVVWSNDMEKATDVNDGEYWITETEFQ